MQKNIVREVEALERMSAPELREKYQEVFGEEPRSTHKDFLCKRIAWRIQANAEGGLSERARRLALEIANDADLRIRAPRLKTGSGAGEQEARSITCKVASSEDRRLPLPGALLVREFRGVTHVVKVLDQGFEYEDQRYKSLSAIAGKITGTKWNGFLFFGLKKSGVRSLEAGERREDQERNERIRP